MTANINKDMLLSNEEIKKIDELGFGDYRPDDWAEFCGSDELNKLIYMAYGLNKVLKNGC